MRASCAVRQVGDGLNRSDDNDVGLAGFLEDDREVRRGVRAELIEDDKKRRVGLPLRMTQDFGDGNADIGEDNPPQTRGDRRISVHRQADVDILAFVDGIVEIDVRSRRAKRFRRLGSEKGVDLCIQPLEFFLPRLENLFLEIFVILDKVPHHVRVFYFFGQNRIDHVHVAQDFKQVSYGCRFADGVKNLDDPVEQIQGQRLVMLRQ